MPSVTYKEYAPHPALAEWIKTYWHFSTHTDNIPNFDIIPDGYFDLLLIFKEGNLINTCLTGIWDKMIRVSYESNMDVIGIRFMPIVLHTPIIGSIASFVNSSSSIELSEFQLETSRFEIAIRSSINIIIQYLNAKFCKLFSEVSVNFSLKGLYQTIENSQGTVSIAKLSELTGYSTRHIHRISKASLGIAAKDYTNIVRFRETLLAEKRNTKDFIGYFDQSHFIKNFKRITGTTPNNLNISTDVRFLQYCNQFNH